MGLRALSTQTTTQTFHAPPSRTTMLASLAAVAGLLGAKSMKDDGSTAKMEISSCFKQTQDSRGSAVFSKYPIKPPPAETKHNTSDPKRADFNRPPPRPDLPTIPLSELQEHIDDDSLWYTFRGGVYDLTDFQQGHPGGLPRLLMAAGQDLEPYWDIYRQHFRGHVLEWMETHRIGTLSEEDAAASREGTKIDDMFLTEPLRHVDLLPATSKPFNGEPRIELLTEDYITPTHLHVVRNHLGAPDVDPEEYRLIVSGKGIKAKNEKHRKGKRKFTLHDLKKFEKHEVVTTLQCAGNRREDMHDKDHKVFIAPHWAVGAMSTAKWGGARLRDVLEECGINVDDIALGKEEPPEGVEHIQLEGYDHDETGYTYGGSFPFMKAVDGLGEVILAYEMNGEDLPRDHGYPIRMIIPGHVGARQVKWLHKIRLSNTPSTKSYQCKSYLGFAPDITFEKDLAHWPPPRLDLAPIIHEQPVTSFVCNPPQNAIVGMKGATDFTFKGVAWSGGGRKVERVDVSVDGGESWTASELYKPIEQKYNHHWAWTQFAKTVPLSADVKERLKRGEKVELDITSKALDSAFNVQPSEMKPYWNARAIAINHWYHVKVTLDPDLPKGEIIRREPEEGFPNTPSGGHFDRKWAMGGWTIDPEHNTGLRDTVGEKKH
jgi:sulfite oxidase